MPHSFSLAVSMNLEHSIKEGSHERYPDHLQCFRNIKKIKYPDFQAMTSVKHITIILAHFVQVDAFIVESKSLHLSCNSNLLYKLYRVELFTFGSCEDLFQGFYPKIYSETVSFMGDLYWSSLANSLTDYYWFNLLKCNRFWHRVTVL